MPQSPDTNRQIVLAERPKGQPDEHTLRMQTTEIPKPGAGEMLVRTVYLSLDPYMRGRMNDAKSYAEPVAIGGVMTAQVVGQVVDSNLERYEPGDFVLSGSGWQDYAISDGNSGDQPGEKPGKSIMDIGDSRHARLYGLCRAPEDWRTETW